MDAGMVHSVVVPFEAFKCCANPEERYDMPLYEYECKQCKRHTEKIQKFSDAEITECPYCGGSLERVVSAPAIAFKGGGWYADGYGNAKPSVAKVEGKSDSGSPSAGATTDAATPAKDTASKPTSSESSSPASPTPTTSTASSSEKK
jgi:putative FmdB family regulatory protein